jgi:hypothetical protein
VGAHLAPSRAQVFKLLADNGVTPAVVRVHATPAVAQTMLQQLFNTRDTPLFGVRLLWAQEICQLVQPRLSTDSEWRVRARRTRAPRRNADTRAWERLWGARVRLPPPPPHPWPHPHPRPQPRPPPAAHTPTPTRLHPPQPPGRTKEGRVAVLNTFDRDMRTIIHMPMVKMPRGSNYSWRVDFSW